MTEESKGFKRVREKKKFVLRKKVARQRVINYFKNKLASSKVNPIFLAIVTVAIIVFLLYFLILSDDFVATN